MLYYLTKPKNKTKLLIPGTSANEPPVLNPLLIPPNIAIGDITEISCTVKRGSQPITFKWLHNGKDIRANTKYKTMNSKTSSHFSIGEIQAEDIGNFTCVAHNAFGTDSKTEIVFMEGKIMF